MNLKDQQVETGKQTNQPVWTWGALGVALLLFLGMCWVQYAFALNDLQRWYMPTYVKTGVRAWRSDSSEAYYDLLFVINKHRHSQLALPEQVELIVQPDGTTSTELTDVGKPLGLIKADIEQISCNDQNLHKWLKDQFYAGHTSADYCEVPACLALGILLVLGFFAGHKDRARSLELLRGQRMAGTEPMSPAGFNRRMRGRRKISVPLLDGVVFVDAARSWLSRRLNNYASRGVYVPREREQQQFVLIGDIGGGKSTVIRQMLAQVEERNEIVIIYDVTGEFLREYYKPERGDIVLNPLDARCPYYALADEIEDDAEATTLAASLFPDRPHEQSFFADAARRLFAHLLCLQPTPQELLYWLSHPEEIDHRIRGTELESLLAADAPQQRMGVLASLNMVADSLRLLPDEDQAKGRFSARVWAKQRRGWIFITATPEKRAALRPLISLWIEMLVLQIMRTGAASGEKTWFVVDEMHSLQRLPQLAMAVTEIRKADCVMVLGFQGRAQIVDLYGPLAEALLSQPATKLFFKTSDPTAAKWISDSIGQVEYLRHRISQSQSQRGQNSESQQQEIVRQSLVMESEIMGLEPLECYLKHGKYAVHLHIQFTKPEERHPAFIQRTRISVRLRLQLDGSQPPALAPVSSKKLSAPKSSAQHQHEFFE